MDLTLSTNQSEQNTNYQNLQQMSNSSLSNQHGASIPNPYAPRERGQQMTDFVQPTSLQANHLISVYLSNLKFNRGQLTDQSAIQTILGHCIKSLQNITNRWNKFIKRGQQHEWLFKNQFSELHRYCHIFVETIRLSVEEILLGGQLTLEKIQQLFLVILFIQQIFKKKINNFTANHESGLKQQQLINEKMQPRRQIRSIQQSKILVRLQNTLMSKAIDKQIQDFEKATLAQKLKSSKKGMLQDHDLQIVQKEQQKQSKNTYMVKKIKNLKRNTRVVQID